MPFTIGTRDTAKDRYTVDQAIEETVEELTADLLTEDDKNSGDIPLCRIADSLRGDSTGARCISAHTRRSGAQCPIRRLQGQNYLDDCDA